jgi:uncharacterized protein YraI
MRTNQTLLLFAAALLAPLAAHAQQAQTTKWVHVRAGPAREYPLVTQLPPAAPVSVQGCLSDYSWCDVITPDNERGWVYAGNLIYPYQNGNVPIVQYGVMIGLPVVTFVLGSYWGSYYQQRPWYGGWHRWDSWDHAHRRPGGARPPPPPHRPDVRPPRPRPPAWSGPTPTRPAPPPRPPAVMPAPQRPPVMRPQPAPRPPPVMRSQPAPQSQPGMRPGQPQRPPGGQRLRQDEPAGRLQR